MVIRIKKPKQQRDWAAVGAHLGLAALEGITLNIPNLLRELRSAGEDTFVEPSIDEKAWIWLYATLCGSLYSIFTENRDEARVDSAEAGERIKRFAQAALQSVEAAEVEQSDLNDPYSSHLMQFAKDDMPELMREISNITDYERLSIDFRRSLRATSARVYALDIKFYHQIDDALSSSMAESERRERAWAKHETWVRSLYERTKVFSPDESSNVKLSDIYQKLRGYWHEPIQTEESDDDTQLEVEEKTSWKVHVDDLHNILHNWLEETGTGNLRVVAGGPGSGKSSFSRAFAVEVCDKTDYRIVFVEMQNLHFESSDISDSLQKHLTSATRHSETNQNGSAGFYQSPLSWRTDADDSILLIFDGLDELSSTEQNASELARIFIQKLSAYLLEANAGGGAPVKAIVLGRSAACNEGLRLAALPKTSLVHVASLNPLKHPSDFGVQDKTLVDDWLDAPEGMCEADQRINYWCRWAELTDDEGAAIPEAVTSLAIGELNTEPLLLHLLIISGYADNRDWEDALENRNRVYYEIFRKVLERNARKREGREETLSVKEAFTALECLALAAWRGAGRTGSNDAFLSLLAHYSLPLYDKLSHSGIASQRYIAVQFHTREGSEQGYEFIHKSFSEYLTARALISTGKRSSRLLSREDDPSPPRGVAKLWSEIVGGATVTYEVSQFVRDEARLIYRDEEDAIRDQKQLAKLFGWVQKYGIPAHEGVQGNFRHIESIQISSEVAMVSVLSAISGALLQLSPAEQVNDNRHVANFEWHNAPETIADFDEPPSFVLEKREGGAIGARRFLNRVLGGGKSYGVRNSLRALPFENADLKYLNLSQSDLSGANLDFASLAGTALQQANFSNASMKFVNFFRAFLGQAVFRHAYCRGSRFDGAFLRGTDFEAANLQRANFNDCFLQNVDFSDADLRGLFAKDATFEDVDFRGSNVDGADFSGSAFISCPGITLEFLANTTTDDDTVIENAEDLHE